MLVSILCRFLRLIHERSLLIFLHKHTPFFFPRSGDDADTKGAVTITTVFAGAVEDLLSLYMGLNIVKKFMSYLHS